MLKKILLKSIFLLIMLSSEGFCVEYNIDNLLKIAEENSANIQAFDLFAQSQKSFANQQKYWTNPTIFLIDKTIKTVLKNFIDRLFALQNLWQN
jgi:hypothetical protein